MALRDGVVSSGSAVPDSSIILSVVIPVYNAQEYIAQSIDSVLNQGRDNVEVILVDDGSEDSSGAICDRYARDNPSIIRVFHRENQGPLVARAEGFFVSRGSYITSLDADDCYLPGSFDAIIEAIEKTDADVILWDYVTTDNGVSSRRNEAEPQFVNPAKVDILRALCSSWDHNAMWRKAIKRDCACLDVDYSAFRGMTLAEDFLQTLAIYDRAGSFCYIKTPLYYYRQNPAGTMGADYQPSHYRDCMTALDVADHYAKKWEFEYSCSGFCAGVAKKVLSSVLDYQEHLALCGDIEGLVKLSESDSFRKRYCVSGALNGIRFDKKLGLRFLWHRHYGLIRLEAMARRVVRGFTRFSDVLRRTVRCVSIVLRLTILSTNH